jgi:hypothetical protein
MVHWYPRKPSTLEEAKLKSFFIRDSILKILHIMGVTRGIEFSETLKLPFDLVEPEIRHLLTNHLIGPVGGAGIGGSNGVDFGLTKEGREQAHSIYQRRPHFGPAPIDAGDYHASVTKQRLQTRGIRRQHLDWAFQGVTIAPGYLEKLGPALNSGGPIFVYGNPGNGKTTLAEKMTKLFRQPIFVPHCIQVDGQIIQFYDEKVHRPFPIAQLPPDHPAKEDPKMIDARWVCVHRPFIIVGGELTLEMLDLIYHDGQDSYEAPFQLKSNLGILLVDDFGRQIVKPKDFLNRWIFPLEKHVDFLTFENGKKIEVPFDQLLIFSTNLHPKDLADEAFWRRIKYKIEIPNPTEEIFATIFRAACEKSKLVFSQATYEYLINKYYRASGREFRAVHPRDLVNHMRDHIAYNQLDSVISTSLIDSVCQLYFGAVDPRVNEAWNA